MEAAAGFLMTPGCLVPTAPPRTARRTPFTNGTEEMPRLPETHQPPAFWEGVLGRTLGMDFKSDPLCVLERDSLP